MTKDEAIKQLASAVSKAISADPAFRVAVHDLSKAGWKLVGVNIDLRKKDVPAPAEDQAENDAAFLRDLRIVPDLSISERSS